ncbi:MAG: hypothetical protein DSY33_06290 [Archaeoglobus sp.]|nr:MAG: hypothetical protein DSY33_06290 [Archaeoglobus sp.]
MNRHITVISDPPEYRAFDIVLREESKVLNFTYTLTTGIDAERYIEEIERSDAIILYSEDISNPVLNAIKNSQAYFVFSNLREVLRGNTVFLRKAREYITVGGIQNIDSLVRLALWVCGERISFSEIVEVPWYGIYHPRIGTFSSIAKYFREYPFASCSKAGIVFSRRKWLYGQVEDAMKLVSELESRMFGVVPVFAHDTISEEYLNCVDIIVNFSDVEYEKLLKFKVPVVNRSSDGIRVYHPQFPGFSEKLNIDERAVDEVVESTVKWMYLSEKRVEDIVVGVYPSFSFLKFTEINRLPFKVVDVGSAEFDSTIDLVLDCTGKCELPYKTKLTPD